MFSEPIIVTKLRCQQRDHKPFYTLSTLSITLVNDPLFLTKQIEFRNKKETKTHYKHKETTPVQLLSHL